MEVKEYKIETISNCNDYYIKIYYTNGQISEPYGPYRTAWQARKDIKKWTKNNKKNKVIARYDKDGKKIEPLSWTDFV